jgi:hypothetical protein
LGHTGLKSVLGGQLACLPWIQWCVHAVRQAGWQTGWHRESKSFLASALKPQPTNWHFEWFGSYFSLLRVHSLVHCPLVFDNRTVFPSFFGVFFINYLILKFSFSVLFLRN